MNVYLRKYCKGNDLGFINFNTILRIEYKINSKSIRLVYGPEVCFD